jgi:uncharacterized membrane protein YjjP (DUF1212 family)
VNAPFDPQASTEHQRAAIRFVETLGRALHRHGAPANRLEDVLLVLSRELGLEGSFYSTPTAVLYAYDLPGQQAYARLQRVHDHQLDLAKLARLDRLFNRVLEGGVDLDAATAEVQRIVDAPGPYPAWLSVACIALASASAAPFFGGSFAEVGLAGLAGLLLGLTGLVTGLSVGLRRLFEPLGAFVVSLAAIVLAREFGASSSVATLAGLIVLVPGFSLTIGATELALNHPASGTARLAGALATLLMLTMGVILGRQIGTVVLGFEAATPLSGAPPDWLRYSAIPLAGLALGILFRTAPRDLPWSVAAVALPFLAFELGLGDIGREASTFVGALIAGCFANLFARVLDRPSMIVRLPGILVLVPGSTGLVSLDAIAGGNAELGVESFFRVAMTATALVAGFFASNAVLPPRKAL